MMRLPGGGEGDLAHGYGKRDSIWYTSEVAGHSHSMSA
jgi:hypothetical protein